MANTGFFFLKVVSCSRNVVSLLLCYIRFFDLMVDVIIQAIRIQILDIYFFAFISASIPILVRNLHQFIFLSVSGS